MSIVAARSFGGKVKALLRKIANNVISPSQILLGLLNGIFSSCIGREW